MEWKLRLADHGDLGKIALIGASTFLEAFIGLLDGNAIVIHCSMEHSIDAYRNLIGKPKTAIWLAEAANGGAPLGYAVVSMPHLEAAQADDLELKRIYAFSRMHGSGLGSALMTEAIEHATRLRAKRLLLGVNAQNARALSFYRRQGFDQIATRRFQVGDQLYDDVVLAKSLNS